MHAFFLLFVGLDAHCFKDVLGRENERALHLFQQKIAAFGGGLIYVCGNDEHVFSLFQRVVYRDHRAAFNTHFRHEHCVRKPAYYAVSFGEIILRGVRPKTIFADKQTAFVKYPFHKSAVFGGITYVKPRCNDSNRAALYVQRRFVRRGIDAPCESAYHVKPRPREFRRKITGYVQPVPACAARSDNGYAAISEKIFVALIIQKQRIFVDVS